MLWTLGVLSLEASWGINCKVGSVGSTAIRWFMHPIYSNYIYHKLSGYASHKPTTICFRVPHLVWSTLVERGSRLATAGHGPLASSGRLQRRTMKIWRHLFGPRGSCQGEDEEERLVGEAALLMEMEGQGGLPAQVSRYLRISLF